MTRTEVSPPSGASPPGSPALSITLVLWNSLPLLHDCLRSIEPEVTSGFAEVIAVDNASPDESADVVEATLPTAKVIRVEQNRGFAGGVNEAWPHVRAGYWMLLNPDTTLDPGGLRGLVSWMQGHPDVAIASPALADHDGTNLRVPIHRLPSASLVVAQLVRFHKLLPPRVRGRLFQGPYWTGGDTVEAGWVPGTAMIVRRQAAEQVGLLDESFFMYGEDIEWCWRMRKAGWRVGCCADVIVRHAGSDSALREYGQAETLLRIARTDLEAVRRGRGPLRAGLYAAAMRASLALESVLPWRDPEVREWNRVWLRAWRAAGWDGIRAGASSGQVDLPHEK